MKNATMTAIYSVLTNIDFDNKEAIMDELYTDIHRYDAVKAEKAAIYDAAKPFVFKAFASAETPLTVVEILEAIADEVSEDFTKYKLAYALTHQWADEVVTTKGKVNTYALKA